MTLAGWMTSPLKKDADGPYRLLWSSGPVIVHDHLNTPQQLVLDYEGKVDDVRLQAGDQNYNGQALGQNGLIRIAANVLPDDVNKLKLVVNHAVKLRSMAGTPVTP